MLHRHPILSTLLVAVLGFAVFCWWALRDGVVTLPGGASVDFSMALQALSGDAIDPLEQSALQRRLRLPAGFNIDLWATGIPNARFMAVSESGDLLVSSPRGGKVYLVADGVSVLLEGLNRPHGLALHDGWLYIGEGAGVSRIRFDATSRTTTGELEKIVQGLPEGGNHWSKTVHVGPDDRLYVTLGSSCNVCEEADPRRAGMLRYELDGSAETHYASGLRNAVDFAWHPTTGALYATDNGRDLLGDDFPPCELNEIVAGGFYGWPYVNGAGDPDPEFGSQASAQKLASAIDPVHGFGAHSAPLGIAFYDGDAFPARYHGAAFVALHGSWNRSRKQGYAVVAVHFNADGSVVEEPFLSGFVIDEKAIGRPVAVAVGVNGELFVSDDYTGSIYRIVYGELASRTAALSSPGSPTTSSMPATSRAGEALWADNDCAGCHLPGQTNTPPALLAGLNADYDVASLQQFLLTPQPPMPLYPFTDDERATLASYLLSRFGD